MEATYDQEDIASYHSCNSTITKSKRTKRRKRTTPAAPELSSYSTNSSIDFSVETATTTTEEEDMAHCLILLAQGGARAAATAPEKFTSRRLNETATTAGGKAGFYVYECKTCSKCFPTFQALGGHRASHKKPKIFSAEENMFTPPVPVIVDATKLRVHECLICGAEFSSGQALGGHMRRHRPIVVASSMENQEIKKLEMEAEGVNNNNSNMGLALDLNLPAPCDEINPGMVGFSFGALVDCHY